jgi:hypothetical protein
MQLKQAIKVVKDHGISMLSSPNSGIRFIAVGNKDTGALDDADDFSITAYVDKKLTPKEMKSQGLNDFKSSFAQVCGKTPGKRDIDVVETTGAMEPLGLDVSNLQRGRFGGQPPSLNAQKWFEELRCGIGVTNPTNEYPNGLSVGTIGFYMTDDDDQLYLVSNNHVIGRSNAAANGESVVQPGTLDLTGLELSMLPTFNDLVQELEIAEVAGVVQIQFPSATGTPNNTVDAAIAQILDSGRGFNDLDRVCFGGAIQGVRPFTANASGVLNQSARVHKVGRTTGFTEGTVVGITGVTNVPYSGGTARFVNQIVIEPTIDNVGGFSDSGDSGSAILNEDHELAGLLFAGNGRHTMANPITDVISQLRTASGIPSLSVITA